MVRTGATFADAAAEFLRYVEHDRALKPSTLRGYCSIVNAYLLPSFGDRRIEEPLMLASTCLLGRRSARRWLCARA